MEVASRWGQWTRTIGYNVFTSFPSLGLVAGQLGNVCVFPGFVDGKWFLVVADLVFGR